MDILDVAKKYIDNYNLEENNWFIFAKKANREEFLKSQEGFYYAVKAFPRILCRLASMIESSEARVLVAENIWEEHGQGKNKIYHTKTYLEYLKSLGFSKDDIAHQPWVDEWIEKVFNKNLNPMLYSMYLAGIEYIYAKISYFISEHIQKYNLMCEQSHYKKHSVLDYEHGKELIKTSLLIQKENNIKLSCDEMIKYFKNGIDDFLNLYTKMIILTEIDAKEIAKEKIAFYYGREDSDIEKNIMKDWHKKNKKEANILMVCSGGENAIELLKMKEINNLTLLDINNEQLNLAKSKIEEIKKNKNIKNELLNFETGKFEKIFSYMRNFLSFDELHGIYLKKEIDLKKLKWICNNIFSNKILEIIFTENATKYSNESFSEHFYKVFEFQINKFFIEKTTESNIGSILFKTSPINYKCKINNKSLIKYFNGDFNNFFNKNNDTYDMIDLSNISDWMSKDEIKKIINICYKRLNVGGLIIGRKLLGNYDWGDFSNETDNAEILFLHDKTMFYTQCAVIKKGK